MTGLLVWHLSINGEDSSNGVGLRIKTSVGAQSIVIDPYNTPLHHDFQPDLHDIRYLGIHAVNLPGARYPSSTNWNNLMNGVSVSNLLTDVFLDNVFFDVAPTWGNSGKAPFTGSPTFASFVICADSTSFPLPSTCQDVTVKGAPEGTAISENAVNCRDAFPPFRSVNDKLPI
ncbi:MAG TPA: hypothetical protein VGI65_01955 [Steroidobacteraceae bacterium]|jgi:hypothetical protein